jgi:hypothetical protein
MLPQYLISAHDAGAPAASSKHPIATIAVNALSRALPTLLLTHNLNESCSNFGLTVCVWLQKPLGYQTKTKSVDAAELPHSFWVMDEGLRVHFSRRHPAG